MDKLTRRDSVSIAQERLAKARSKLASLDPSDGEYKIKKNAAEFEVQTLLQELAGRSLTNFAAHPNHTNDELDTNNLHFPTSTNNYNLPTLPIRDTTYPRPQSSSATLSHSTDFPTYPGLSHNGFDGHFASDGALLGQTYDPSMPGSWNFDALNNDPPLSTVPPLNVDDSTGSASVSSPDSNFAMPRKRKRPSLALTDTELDRESKSFRTSQSPNVTGDTTPASFDDFPEDILALLGTGGKESMKELRESQLRQEREAKERNRIIQRDEEIARSLQQQDIMPEWPSSSIPSEANYPPSTPSRTTLETGGRYRTPTPMPTAQMPSSPSSASTSGFAPPQTPVRAGPSKHSFPYSSTSHRPSNQSHNSRSDFNESRSGPLGNTVKREEPKYSSYSGNQPHRNPIKRENTAQDHSSGPDWIDLLSESDSIPPTPYRQEANRVIDLDSEPWEGAPYVDLSTESATDASNYYSNLANGFTDGFAQFGQNLADSANGIYNAAQDMVSFGGNSLYGSDFFDLTGESSSSAIADSAFARAGLDPSNRQMYDEYLERIDHVSHDPTKTKDEIKTLLQNIRPDEDLPPQNREGTPEAMTYPLLEHQKLGLAWMKKMEDSEQKGGILADDMGLGKTIQALALMVSKRSTDPLCKTTLIIAPVALMKQWEREIETKLKPGAKHKLKTFVLHKAARLQKWETLRTYDVVLTTFGTLCSELKRRETIDMKKRANPNWRPTAKEDILSTLGDDCRWYRVIIDEAQCIKNKNTKAAMAAFELRAKSRFCMTGTPMMNSIDELYSLVHFIRISPWKDYSYFSRNFSRPLKGSSPKARQQAMQKLQVLLKAILLRRTKKSVIDGRPILDLPARSTESQHAAFSPDEHELYHALETRTQLQFNKYLRANSVGRNYSNILVLLLRLRQACCHPHLIRDFGQEGFAGTATGEDMVKLAKELAVDVVARLKEQTESSDGSALECPVCMDMAENATIFIPCGHNTCSECFTRIADPSQAIANGDDARTGEAKCPNCRGKVIASKVIDHETFKKVHMPQAVEAAGGFVEEEEDDSEASDDSELDTDDEDDEEEVDSKGNLKDFIVSDEDDDDEEEAGYRKGKTPFEKASKRKAKRSKGKGKSRAKGDAPSRKTLAQLKKESLRNVKAKRRYLNRLRKEFIPSAKIEKTLEILRDVQHSKSEATGRPEKTIIFSQFTSLLDLLEVPISEEGWKYRRYDGSMDSNARNNAVIDFTDKPEVKIMLISLKAGNAGLNLTAASQVIIFDPFWNPYIEEQAIDRAHRIGQMNPVHVHRILVPDTVEDRILALQEKKRGMIEAALDESESKRIGRLGTADLAFLFDVPLHN